MKVKKILRIIAIIFLSVFIFITAMTLYIGNYVYDYTLNPTSDHYIFENLDLYQDDDSAQKWFAQHSRQVAMTSDDDLQLHGYYFSQNSPIYVIMVHGYRSHAMGLLTPAQHFYRQGYNLLIPDLRGHGQSQGDYIAMGWDDRLDLLKWIDYVLLHDRQAQIVLYGVSMGGAAVMNVSGEKLPSQVKAIIEDCGYTSVWDIFQSHIPMSKWQSEIALHMASIVTKIRAGYDLKDVQPLKQVAKSQTPILFIHGSDDQFVPCQMVDTLYDAATCPKEKLIIQGAGHANSCSVDSQTYYQHIFRFIERYTKKEMLSSSISIHSEKNSFF